MKRLFFTLFFSVVGTVSGAEVADPQNAWQSVGVLRVEGGDYCRVTLVDRNLALTAAHCLTNPEGVVEALDRSVVFPGGQEARVRDVALVPGFRYADLDRAPIASLAQDVAVLSLDQDIVLSPVNILTFAGDSHVWVPQEGGWERCVAKAMPPPDVFHIACGREKGFSGAPVFRIDGTGIHIVGVVSARDPIEGGVFANAIKTSLAGLRWTGITEEER